VCIELAGTQFGEPCGRRWGLFFFSRVLHNKNHACFSLHPLLSERNDHCYELRRRRHERGLFLRPTIPNAISYNTDS